MSETPEGAAPAAPGLGGWLRRRLPIPLLLTALVAALLHIAPFWAAEVQTPAGWKFTGHLNGSPDEMQYRMLTERTLAVGPVVDNRLTTEPNQPHIAMFFYWGVAKLSAWLGASEAYVYSYLGSVIAFLLALVLFWIIDHFVRSRYQTWWVFLTLLFGGGLGAHLMLLNDVDRLRGIMPFQRIVTEGLRESIVFENYRSHYIFTTLFDTHFLFFLLMALLAIVAFYRAIVGYSIGRVALAGLAFGLATVLHIYDGVTLLFVAASVVALLWLRKLPVRPAMVTLVVCGAAVAAATLWQVLLFRGSGLGIPPWRAQAIYFSELALAYPLAWGLIAWGLGRYWRDAGLEQCFLLGWALGCTALTLSGPFYPYSDRGTLTLQVPLMIVAGAIYFSWRPRVSWQHAAFALVLLGATPIWQIQRLWINRAFDNHPSGGPPPYTWMNPDHQALVAALDEKATAEDVLIVDKTKVPWRTDDLWLTMGFPGRLYAGHYALTPGYERRRDAVNAFFAAPIDSVEFLRRERIRFVYVGAERDLAPFEQVPGLAPVKRTAVGTLFEYAPAAVR
ncbi:MAG: hypothetical protein AB7R55_20375 [Gemmatimonadales bacterium]